MRLIFGANTDDDTFGDVFGHMIGYVLRVNDQDMQLTSTWHGDQPGLYGHKWDDELERLPDMIFVPWDEIEEVEIY